VVDVGLRVRRPQSRVKSAGECVVQLRELARERGVFVQVVQHGVGVGGSVVAIFAAADPDEHPATNPTITSAPTTTCVNCPYPRSLSANTAELEGAIDAVTRSPNWVRGAGWSGFSPVTPGITWRHVVDDPKSDK